MTTAEDTLLPRRAPDLTALRNKAALVGAGAIGLAVVISFFTGFRHFMHGWLIGYLLFFGLTLGCLALGMLNSVTGGRWGEVIRPIMVSGAKALGLMFVLFIPLLLNLQANYPWARPTAEKDLPLAQRQWLNPSFFTVRWVGYFVIWSVFLLVLVSWNRRREREHLVLKGTGPGGVARITGPGLAIYGVTVTFAAVDWVMSVEPAWFSTILGLSTIAGQGLTALAFGTFVLWLLTERVGRVHKAGDESGRVEASTIEGGHAAQGPLVGPNDWGDLGNLMMAFTMLWAYMAFSQFLIQWAGNLPGEVRYFIPRVRTAWRFVGLMLIFLHFALPFFMLFSRNIKRSAHGVGRIAGWILLMRLVDWIWLIQPSVQFHTPSDDGLNLERMHFGGWFLMDILVPVGIGGLWVAFFLWQLSGKVVLPAAPPAEAHGHEQAPAAGLGGSLGGSHGGGHGGGHGATGTPALGVEGGHHA